jgi:tRNA threonylcarbamoyladenosine biosynthesis protein TsaE
MKIISKSVEETAEIAKGFIEKLSLGVSDKAVVVGLYGDLGSGKTTFTQAVAKLLNINECVTSPTFVIQKRYPINSPKSKVQSLKKEKPNISSDLLSTLSFPLSTFIHIDAYRLDSGKELLALDFERDLNDSRNLIFIEWPERVSDILPENHLKINFKFVGENEREIEI